MADSPPVKPPPGPDVNSAPKLLGITGGLYLVSLLLYGGRIYTRLKNRRLGWDDYHITAALILALIEWSLFLASVQHGAGRHNYYVPLDEQVAAEHLLYASTMPWAVSMMFIKISIACMLLRIKNTKWWLSFLWSMIAIQIASCIASEVFELVQCVPLAAIWDPKNHPNAVCAKSGAAFVSIYVNSGIAIATDLIFAVVPITFIHKMRRPLREKIILSCLMGLGVFAAAASIVKTTLVKHYGATGDSLWDAIDLTLWSMLEEQTGIIAACIPCLKSPFERVLNRLGLLSSVKRSMYRNNDIQGYDGYNSKGSHQLTPIRAARIGVRIGISSHGKSSDAQSQETIWPGIEADKTLRQLPDGRIVKTTEVTLEEENMPKCLQHERHGKNNAREWKEGEGSRTLGNWNAV